MNNRQTGYLGTYASPQSAGIYRFTLDRDTGALSLPRLFYGAQDAKYLSLRGHLLAAPLQGDGTAGLCLLDTAGGRPTLLGVRYEEARAACHVAQDDEFLYAANYHEGTVLICRKTEGGPVLHRKITIAPEAGCHQVLFHGRYLLVPCLLLDRIMLFDHSRNDAPAGSIPFPRGTGPRHGVFTGDHSRFFLVSECSNEVFVFRPGEGPDWDLLSVHPLLAPGARFPRPPASAAIRLSPDGRFLYVSTRFADILSVFSVKEDGLTLLQQTGSGGIHPRDFVLTEDGRFLLAANRTAGGLVCFPLDGETGRIGPACSSVPAPEAVSIVLEETAYEKGEEWTSFLISA